MSENNKKIKAIFTDLDGTLTDGKVYVCSSKGETQRAFDSKDLYSLYDLLRETNIKIHIISASPPCKGIKQFLRFFDRIDIHMGIHNKSHTLSHIMAKNKYDWDEIAYIGDDDGDYGPMSVIPLSACPQNSSPKIKEVALYHLSCDGGNGAFREFLEKLKETNRL